MYAVGEYLVHPGQGVCVVDDIADTHGTTYQLVPVGVRNPMRISFPASEESRLRPVLSADEAKELIAGYDDIGIDTKVMGSPALEEDRFREELRRGDCRVALRIVKTIRARIAEAQANKRKAPVAFERVLKLSSQRAYTELSVALGCTVDEVQAMFGFE